MGQPLGLGRGGVMKVGLLGALGLSITLVSLGVVFIVGDSPLWERGKVSRRERSRVPGEEYSHYPAHTHTHTHNHTYNTHTHAHELRYHPYTNAHILTS
jgi:hypothetical protein